METNRLLEGWRRWLLGRRSVEDPKERAYYRVFAPAETTLPERVAVVARRWAVEECFAAAKGEVGLDQYAVRSGTGWHRHSTLSRLAHAYLTAVRAQSLGQTPPKKKTPRKSGLRGRSGPEIRYLLWFLVWQKAVEQSWVRAWSVWRCQHQARAQFYHYQRRHRSG